MAEPSEIQRLHAEIAAAQKTLADAEQAWSDLLNASVDDYNSTRNEVKELKRERDQRVIQANAQATEIAELQTALALRDRELAEMSRLLTKVKTALAAAEGERTFLIAEVTQANEACRYQVARADAAEQALATLQVERDANNDALQDMQRMYDSLQAENAQLKQHALDFARDHAAAVLKAEADELHRAQTRTGATNADQFGGRS